MITILYWSIEQCIPEPPLGAISNMLTTVLLARGFWVQIHQPAVGVAWKVPLWVFQLPPTDQKTYWLG